MTAPYYDNAGVTIYHGDCRDVLADLRAEYSASVDLVLTDPPYGQQFAGGGVKTAQANIRADGARQGVRVVRQALHAVSPILKLDAHMLVFCHWESWPDFYDACSAYMPIKSALIWWKNRGGMGDTEMEYARDYEVILYGAHGRRPISGRRDGAVLSGFAPIGTNRLHPTEKPYDLLQHLVRRHAPSDGLVLDPFMGSGTSVLAARNLGRRAIGIEIEERYCAVAAQRLEQQVLPLADGAA